MLNTSVLHLRKSLTLGLTLLFLLAGAISARPVAAATATLEPTSVVDGTNVKAGAKFIVRASGFNNGETISTWASYGLRPTVYATAGGNADSSGNISLEIKVGRFWEPGWWALTVSSNDESRKAIVNFKVEATPPDGTLDIEPLRDVRGGEQLMFHGIGFNINDTIKIWVTRANGTADEVLTGITIRGNEVWFSYLLPVGAASGRWSATAYGLGSERLLIRDFNVVP